MAAKKTPPPPPAAPAWMQSTQENLPKNEVITESESSNSVKAQQSLKLEFTESTTDLPCVVVQGRGSRENVSYINVPFTQEQIQRLQSRIFGNQAVAIPILLMRALDEIEEKKIRLEIKASRQSS
jgi:hypothetical protein